MAKCRHPKCDRVACDVPPKTKIVNDRLEGEIIETVIVIDEARDADGYCCVFCRWTDHDQAPILQHAVRCNRRAKGLPEVDD